MFRQQVSKKESCIYFIFLYYLHYFLLIPPFSLFFRAKVESDPATGNDEIMFCCGQLIAHGLGEHVLCHGKEDKFTLGLLLLELEKCPHSGCGARFGMTPLRNLEHQDTIHHCILSYLCGACRGCFVTEGSLLHHIMKGHGGPKGFEVNMNIKHGECYLVKTSYMC